MQQQTPPSARVPLKPKQIFAIELDIDYKRIMPLADNMQSILDDFKPIYSPKQKIHYLYRRSSARINNILLNINNLYQDDNIKPPHTDFFSIPKIRNLRKFKSISAHTNPQEKKEDFGKEKSVSMHDYNDYLPIAISVHDFTELYTPKTIQYMWANNFVDYEIAIKLKSDLNDYLKLTNNQRAHYMKEITNVRIVTETDIYNDACDKEILGHRGVFAKKDIQSMSIIGIYTGIFIQNPRDMITLMQKMPMEYFKDYLFRVPLYDNFPKITGYQYGNRLSIINAASNYQETQEITFEQIRKRANIMLVAAKSNECPNQEIAQNENCPDVLFFVAGRDIPQGTQLLYDYGNVYW